MRLSIAQFRGFDNRIYILSLGWLVTSAGFAMVIPFMSIYFHEELGLSMSAIGVFFGFTAVLRAIPQPMAGWLSDRFGRVVIMGWSQILRSFTFAGVAWAIIAGKSFWVIASIISLNYILGAVLHPSANAMVADLVKKEDRISAYAMLRIAGNLGWAIGPAMGGFIAHISYGGLFYVSSVLMLFSGLFFLFALKDVEATKPRESNVFIFKDVFNITKDKKLFEHCLISFLMFLAVSQFIAPLSVYSTESIGISKAQLGWLYAINGGMVVFLQFFISGRFKNFKLTHQLAIGAIIYAFGYFLIAFASQFWNLVLFMIIITIAEMIVSPPSVTMVANLSAVNTYGRYMGIFGLFQMAGWSLGPTVGGILMDLFAYNTAHMWYVIAVMAFAAAVLYMRFGRKIDDDVNSGRQTAKAHAG